MRPDQPKLGRGKRHTQCLGGVSRGVDRETARTMGCCPGLAWGLGRDLRDDNGLDMRGRPWVSLRKGFELHRGRHPAPPSKVTLEYPSFCAIQVPTSAWMCCYLFFTCLPSGKTGRSFPERLAHFSRWVTDTLATILTAAPTLVPRGDRTNRLTFLPWAPPSL